MVGAKRDVVIQMQSINSLTLRMRTRFDKDETVPAANARRTRRRGVLEWDETSERGVGNPCVLHCSSTQYFKN